MNIINRKRGVAIAVVMVFCTAILGLVSVLLFNTRSRRGTYDTSYEQTRALLAARSAIQLAIYKYRVLPSEYYKIHRLEDAIRKGISTAGGPAVLAATKGFWLEDCDSSVAGSPAELIKDHLDQLSGAGHNFRVEEFSIVSKAVDDYVQDFLHIRAEGSFGDSRKFLEELVEISVAR